MIRVGACVCVCVRAVSAWWTFDDANMQMFERCFEYVYRKMSGV